MWKRIRDAWLVLVGTKAAVRIVHRERALFVFDDAIETPPVGRKSGRGCAHVWNEDSFRRWCDKCGAQQMLCENRYPDVGRPKYEWK